MGKGKGKEGRACGNCEEIGRGVDLEV